MSVMIEIKFGKRNILAGVVILTSMNTYISLLLFSRVRNSFVDRSPSKHQIVYDRFVLLFYIF